MLSLLKPNYLRQAQIAISNVAGDSIKKQLESILPKPTFATHWMTAKTRVNVASKISY